MFKKHHIQVKFVKDQNSDGAAGANIPTAEEIAAHTTRILKQVGIGAGILIAGTVVLVTASQMAVSAFEHQLNN